MREDAACSAYAERYAYVLQALECEPALEDTARLLFGHRSVWASGASRLSPPADRVQGVVVVVESQHDFEAVVAYCDDTVVPRAIVVRAVAAPPTVGVLNAVARSVIIFVTRVGVVHCCHFRVLPLLDSVPAAPTQHGDYCIACVVVRGIDPCLVAPCSEPSCEQYVWVAVAIVTDRFLNSDWL